MDYVTLMVIAVGLAMDCFAVSLGVGTTNFVDSLRSRLRLAFHFGVFQGGMTLLGWLVGNTVVQLIAAFDHWVAFALLVWVGGRMIREGLDPECKPCREDPSRGRTLVVLSVATSLDALAVGLSLAMIRAQIFFSSLMIGLMSLLLSQVGIYAGRRLSVRFGKRMEIVGGCVLIFIGLRIVLTHIFNT